MSTARTGAAILLGLLVVTAAGWSGELPRGVDQSLYYGGTVDECGTRGGIWRFTHDGFQEMIPAETGEGAVILLTIGVHVEPHREYLDPARYDLDRARILRLAEIVERHGGRLTVQVQRPFTEVAQQRGDRLLLELARRGHEVALHYHEDFHLPNASVRPVSAWVSALRREIALIETLSEQRVTTWSGGNLYPHAFEAAVAVGLENHINYKDLATQGIPAPFMVLTPWRPVGSGSVSERTTHDPDGKIVYVPCGVYPAHCPGAEGVPKPYSCRGFDYVTIALRNSLRAALPADVNTFIATVHPGDFLAPADDEVEFALWEAWLAQTVDPLVASGRVRWATVTEMAAAFDAWQGASAGTGSSGFTCRSEPCERVEGGWTTLAWVPSEAAPDRGIAVRLIYPERPRYEGGSAAVVEVPGGDTAGSVDLPPRLATDPYVTQGMVRVQFAFPGGGRPPLSSGGTYDHRGLDSLRALRDVVRFLRGEVGARGGCGIGDLLPYPILQVGLIGLSNGGNTAVAALGLFGDAMAVDWYVGWENPAGVQFATVDLGSREGTNPAYITGSGRLSDDGAQCDVNYRWLRWDSSGQVVASGPRGHLGPGVLYHDLNENNRYDPGDYALGAYLGMVDGREKRVFSAHALAAVVARGLLGAWPADVATLEEAQRFWQIRDMSRYYRAALAGNPDLRVVIIGSVEDHVQRTADHAHIVLQYAGWQEAGAWVRLNPDASYVLALGPELRGLSDSDANASVTYANVSRLLAREGIPDPILQLAAVIELSDRVLIGCWNPDLVAPLSLP